VQSFFTSFEVYSQDASRRERRLKKVVVLDNTDAERELIMQESSCDISSTRIHLILQKHLVCFCWISHNLTIGQN